MSALASFRRHGFGFDLLERAQTCAARRGVFHTPHGEVPTPAFMPVGTRGTIKGLLPRDVRAAGASMVLANTYHLHLRPGEDTVQRLGGLHAFMDWEGPILTDSGGYQVFSMGDINQVDGEGVTFKSIVDGTPVRFTPERVMDIQWKLGADVAMAFDHCPEGTADRRRVEDATERTHRWLERCVRRHRGEGREERGQALFGIVQGGVFEDLRRRSVEAVCEHDLIGYAIGGVSVGEEKEHLAPAVEASAPYLPEDRPRYLMGVGTPEDFLAAVMRGCDLFDCVTPTRHARNHQAFTSRGRVNLRNRGWKEDERPLDPACACVCCTRYSRGVLRHLCTTDEMLGPILLTIHNLTLFHGLLARLREAVTTGDFETLRSEVVAPMSRRVRPED